MSKINLELVLLSFLCGVVGGAGYVWFSVVAIFGCWCWVFRVRERERGRVSRLVPWGRVSRLVPWGRVSWLSLIVCLLVFGGGWMRADYVYEERYDFVRSFVGEGQVMVSGEVVNDPVMFESASFVTIWDSERGGKVRMKVARYPEYWRGQVMMAKGRVEVDERSFESGTVFIDRSAVEAVHDPDGALGVIFGARRTVVEQMQRLFPGSVGGFLVGIIAGGTRGLSREVSQDVRATGLTHIVAVSGYNVALVLQVLMFVLVAAGVARRHKLIPMTGFLVIFVLFVGASASAVRAALMGFLTVFALVSGRKRGLFLAILWSGFFMVLYDPTVLLEDRGFQLSFLATIGVSYLAPLLYTGKNPIFLAFFSTLAVYLCTLPVLFSFEQFSLIGLVTNIVFVPFIPYFMILGVLVFSLSWLYFPLAALIGRLGSIVIDLYFQGIHLFAHLPFAVIQVPPMSGVMIAVYYAFLLEIWHRLGALREHHQLRREP